jgi:restriction system protein
MEKLLGSLLLFGFALPWYFAQKVTGSVPAAFSAGLGGLVLTLLILLWLSVQRDRYQAELQRRRDFEYVASGMAAIDQMSGVEFEEYVAAQLRTAGWSVTHTTTTGDYGVDLIAEKDGTCMAIQCKRLAKAVGVAAIQQVVSGALHHGCQQTVVVTNQAFTKAAGELASTHRCRLVARAQLQTWAEVAPTPVRNPRPHQRTDRARPHAERRRVRPELEAEAAEAEALAAEAQARANRLRRELNAEARQLPRELRRRARPTPAGVPDPDPGQGNQAGK